MSKPKLALIPSGYKSGKVYSILPNDATGDFDFERQSIGTRVRKDGLIEEAKTSGSITNVLLYSEDYSQVNWAKTSVTVTTNQFLAPDGTNSADKLDFSSSTSARMAQVINAPAGNYTFSVYLRSVSGSGDFRIRLQSGGGINLTVSLTEQWQRFDLEYYHSGGASLIPYIGYYIDASYIQEVYSWGAMVSEGALSDYIKTEGTTETKTVETFTDVPRLDWLNSNCPSLLLESQRTNLQVYSEQFDNGVWVKTRTTITANDTISPNGELTADKLTGDGTGTSYVYDGISLTNGNTYTISIFVKPIINISSFAINVFGGVGTAYFNLVDKTVNSTSGDFTSAKIEDYGNGWLRCIGTLTLSSTTGSKNIGYGLIDFNGDQYYLFGAQVEQGDYPTSYIKTEASTVTRLVDSCEVASGLENVINQTEGVFYIEFEYLYETTTDSSTDANRDILVMGTASDISEGISIDNFRSQFRVFIQGSGMTTQSVGNNTAGSSQPNTRYKLAVNYKSGDNKAYLNGSLLGTVQTGNVSFVTDLDGIFFSYNSSSRPFKNQKKVYDLRVYDTVLTDNELIELTTL